MIRNIDSCTAEYSIVNDSHSADKSGIVSSIKDYMCAVVFKYDWETNLNLIVNNESTGL